MDMDEHTTPTDDGTPSFARSFYTGVEVRPTAPSSPTSRATRRDLYAMLAGDEVA